MRTRTDIEHDAEARETEDKTAQLQDLKLEVLLDVRDLLEVALKDSLIRSL